MKTIRSFLSSRALPLWLVAALAIGALAPMARAQDPGTLDTTFSPGEGPSSSISSLVVGSDGKFLIRGDFYQVDGTYRSALARLNADGSLDTGFDSDPPQNTSNYAYDINSLAVQSDGKVVIGGSFTQFDGEIREYVARLNVDGTLDSTYTTNSGANDVVDSVALQSDGKAVIGGNFYQFQGENRQGIARINTDGTLDESFDPGVGPDGEVGFVRVQSNGKIIIAGNFGNVDGVARFRLARLNANGSLDTGFDPGVYQNGSLNSLAVQSDGKVIIGGQFMTVDSVARVNIARLNANGSLDTGFDPGAGPNGEVTSIAVQTDGQIVIGGTFTEVNNTARNRIAQLYADGSLDTAFKPGSGPNSTVEAVAVQDDGKVVIAGDFTIINGVAQNYIARLFGEPVPVITSAAAVTVTVNTPFNYQITATNTPTSYGVGGLFKGITANQQTGLISGTPTATGTHTLILKATNGAGTGTQTLTLSVKPPKPAITSATTATAYVGKAFSYQIKATNTPTSYGVGGLFQGIMVDQKTGLISGTPTAPGTHTLTLRATNAGGTGTTTLTLKVVAVPSVTSQNTATAKVGQAFSYQITASNTPTSYGVGGLFQGITVNQQTGLLSGTPTAAGTHSLDLRATNGAGTGHETLTLTISN